MTLVCAPPNIIPALLPPGDEAVALYSNPTRKGMGSAGSVLLSQCRRAKIAASPRAWDLVSIALAVLSADEGTSRDTSPDGWTRSLGVSVAVANPKLWQRQTASLERLLGFLTGDIWQISFIGGGFTPAPPTKRCLAPETVVCLLSGGLDSLVGAIDLVAAGRKPFVVSQVANGDKDHQRQFASGIGGGLRHLQLNHLVRPPKESERSQRARSFIFLAFGVLAATSLDIYRRGDSVELVVPENGFISLNVPLTPLRLGSLSTRTTHPAYLQQLQSVLDVVGLRVGIVNPYQFKTKGEMLTACADQDLLARFATRSTSCGRFARHAFTHCGRCIPCLIRRAAFHRWGVSDATRYVCRNIARNGHDDVRAAAMAVERVRLHGVEAWIGSSLTDSQLGDRTPYVDTARRGLDEVGAYLRAAGAL